VVAGVGVDCVGATDQIAADDIAINLKKFVAGLDA
jgi:hypothetical protein